jgi:hypothetical protein
MINPSHEQYPSDTQDQANNHFGRRGFLQLAGIGAALTALAGCDAISDMQDTAQGKDTQSDTDESSEAADSYEVGLYVPTWLADADYKRVEALSTGSRVGSFILSFALPKTNGSLLEPVIQPGLTSLLKAHPDSKVGIGIGGWSDGEGDAGHQRLLDAWETALNNPDSFIENTTAMVKKLGADSVDFDFEYPTEKQADRFASLVHDLRDELPKNVGITMAVPSGNDIAGLALGRLVKDVDTFHVMTYDEVTPSNSLSGDVAPGHATIEHIDQWIKYVDGDASKISVGYPTYGYQYHGAKKRGDKFDPAKSLQVSYRDQNPDTVHDNPKTLTSSARIDGDWTSFQSPAMIKKTHAVLLKRYPKLGGAFFWAAGGITDEQLDAIAKK